jgi:predicted ATPase
MADAGLEVATLQGFPFWSAFHTIMLGWVSVSRGKTGEGIDQTSRGMKAYADTGAELLRPYFLGLLAEAFAERGWFDRGLALLNEAVAIVDKSGERFYEAELYRKKGEMLVRSHSAKPDSEDLTARSSPARRGVLPAGDRCRATAASQMV